MGARFSCAVPNIYMEHFEITCLPNFTSPIIFWKRYIDDICSAVKAQMVDTLLCFLNGQNDFIKFTVERENHGYIS